MSPPTVERDRRACSLSQCVCYSQVAGRTKSAEAGEKTQGVNIFYSQPLAQIPVLGTFGHINVTQVMAVDKQTSDARFVVDFLL